MPKVLVAGAAGTLGHKTCLALSRLPGMSARGLVRSLDPSDPSKRAGMEEMRAAGVELVVGDLMQPETLPAAVQGVDVVVSTVLGPDEVFTTGQGNLLEAAQKAGVKKFLASTFSLDIFSVEPGAITSNPIIDVRRRFADTLAASGMPYLHINMGVFMEVFWGFFKVWHPATKALRFYGSPDSKIEISTYDDVAEWTARAAVDESATGVLEFAGEKMSMREVAAVYKQVKGEELKLECLGSMENLRAEIERQRAADPANWQAWVPLTYQYNCFGAGQLKHIANNRYPEVKPTSMRAFLESNRDLEKVAWYPH